MDEPCWTDSQEPRSSENRRGSSNFEDDLPEQILVPKLHLGTRLRSEVALRRRGRPPVRSPRHLDAVATPQGRVAKILTAIASEERGKCLRWRKPRGAEDLLHATP